jgi:hypothetical protein
MAMRGVGLADGRWAQMDCLHAGSAEPCVRDLCKACEPQAKLKAK